MSECVEVTGLSGAGTVEVTSVDGSHVVEVDSVCPVGVIEVPTVCGPSIVEVDSRQPGPPGPANSLSIGTVETLPPDEPATATITGTPPSQVLSLGIPQGAEGDGLPVVTDIAELDGLTGTAVYLLDDPPGVTAATGLPFPLEAGPVLVEVTGVTVGAVAAALQILNVGIAILGSHGGYRFQRVVQAGSTAAWEPIPGLPTPASDNRALVSSGGRWLQRTVSSTSQANSIMVRDGENRAQIRDPLAAQDIANKQYVDTAVAGGARSTEWRDITATGVTRDPTSVVIPVNAGRFLIRRDGNQVTAVIEALDPTEGARLAVPFGFRNRLGVQASAELWDGDDNPLRLVSSTAYWYRPGEPALTPGVPRWGTFSWWTSNTFPTTLPGVPA